MSDGPYGRHGFNSNANAGYGGQGGASYGNPPQGGGGYAAPSYGQSYSGGAASYGGSGGQDYGSQYGSYGGGAPDNYQVCNGCTGIEVDERCLVSTRQSWSSSCLKKFVIHKRFRPGLKIMIFTTLLRHVTEFGHERFLKQTYFFLMAAEEILFCVVSVLIFLAFFTNHVSILKI
jgi:hypothetical protein